MGLSRLRGPAPQPGLVRPSLPVKVLGRGEVDRRLTVRAHAVSGTARAKIEAAGGAVEIIEAVH